MGVLDTQYPNSFDVTCLQCGYVRSALHSTPGQVEPGECPWCRYVGWHESGPIPSVLDPAGARSGTSVDGWARARSHGAARPDRHH
jgi:hypothetical protein